MPQLIGAYSTPSLSISSPPRPVKPTICHPDGAVKVVVSEVAVPDDRVRPLSVANAAEKIRVRPSFWPSVSFTEVRCSSEASVRDVAVPPVPPWVRAVPPSWVRDSESRRASPRRVRVRGATVAGRSSASLNAVPCGPPKKSLALREEPQGVREADRVREVVGEVAALGVQELGPLVVVAGRVQGEQPAAAVEDLVDDLAVVRRGRRGAEQRVGALRRCRAALDQLHPGVRQSVVVDQRADVVGAAGVAGVRVTHDEHRVARRVRPDEVRELLDVGAAGRERVVGVVRVGVRVVEVEEDALGQPHPGEREALRGQAVGARALVPLHPLEVVERVVRKGVEAVAHGRAAARRRAVGVVVARVQRRVVVEVLLDVHDVVGRQPR